MRFTTYLTTSALAALASAQTWTACNPMEKTCPNDPAMPAIFDTDFKAGAANVKGWKQTAGSLTYSGEGAEFTINQRYDAPTIQSEGYLHFGYVEVRCKAAAGQGIISSIVLQSEDLDEVDWEFLGTVSNTVQMNYFGKGNTTTYDRMIEAPVANVQDQMHTYALDWTAERIVFLIDGVAVRTLAYADANGGKNYPQTPSTVRIGIWAGGDPGNQPGVIEWAGGKTDFTKAPFTMTVESVKVKNYSPGKEYKWTDKSGSWQSIEVIGKGDAEGAPENDIPISPTASATATDGGLASGIDTTDVPTSTGAIIPSDTPIPTGTDAAPIVPTGTLIIPTNSAGYPVGTGVEEALPPTTGTEQPPYPTAGGNGTLPQTSCTTSNGPATEIVTSTPPVETPTESTSCTTSNGPATLTTLISSAALPAETPAYGDMPPVEAPSGGAGVPPVQAPASSAALPAETPSYGDMPPVEAPSGGAGVPPVQASSSAALPAETPGYGDGGAGVPPVDAPNSSPALPAETPSYGDGGAGVPPAVASSSSAALPAETPFPSGDVTPPFDDAPYTGTAMPPSVSQSPAPENPPYPTSGLRTETKPSPSGAFPTGGYGSPSGTGAPVASPTPSQFFGSASSNKAGALAVLVAAAAFLI